MANKHNEALLDSLIRHAGHQILIEMANETPAQADEQGLAGVLKNLDERMRKVIIKNRRRQRMQKLGRAAVKVAVVLVVALIISTIAIVSSEALRETVISMLISDGEESAQVMGMDEDNVESSGLIVTPAYLPDGFVLKETLKTDWGFKSIYENAQFETISIEQGYLGMDLAIDVERHESEQIEIGGRTTYVFFKERESALAFDTDVNTFIIFGQIGKKEIINVAKSMIK